MMTDVAVVPSLGGLLMGCVLLMTGSVLVEMVVGCTLLLIGTVSDTVIALPLMVGRVFLQTGTVGVVVIAPTDWELTVSSGIDAGESEYITSTCMACHQWYSQGRAHWGMCP